MKTKQPLQEIQQQNCDCITEEEHREHLEEKEEKLMDVQSRLQWMALNRSGGIYPVAQQDGPSRVRFTRSY